MAQCKAQIESAGKGKNYCRQFKYSVGQETRKEQCGGEPAVQIQRCCNTEKYTVRQQVNKRQEKKGDCTAERHSKHCCKIMPHKCPCGHAAARLNDTGLLNAVNESVCNIDTQIRFREPDSKANCSTDYESCNGEQYEISKTAAKSFRQLSQLCADHL